MPDIEDAITTFSDGARRLSAMALDRLEDAKQKIIEGDFEQAEQFVRSAALKLHPLAHAQIHLGGIAEGSVALAKDVEAGWELNQWGIVRQAEHCVIEQPGMREPAYFVRLSFEGEMEAIEIPMEQEVFVLTRTP